MPTFAESGYPKADFSAWFGVFVPAGTPAPIIAALNAKAVAAVQAPDARRQLEEAGFSVSGTSTEDITRLIEVETVRWKKVVTATGFKGD